MILVDQALKRRQEEGRPVRVGIVGAGAMGRMITLQILQCVPGMEVVAVANRTLDRARAALLGAGCKNPVYASKPSVVEDCVAIGGRAFTDDPDVLCDAEGLDGKSIRIRFRKGDKEDHVDVPIRVR